jgi:hypothetical protein
VLLKTFQKLGYFVMVNEVPRPILQHIAQSAGYEAIPDGLGTYDASSVRRRHMALVRDYVGVSTWCEAAQKIVADACRDAARTRDDLADTSHNFVAHPAAIALAIAVHADGLLIDEYEGRREAEHRGLPVTGTLGVLGVAHRAGLLDFETALAELRRTNFYVSDVIVNGLREKLARAKDPV